MNILFIADVNKLSHDLKWISFFSRRKDEYKCFQISLKEQFNSLRDDEKNWFHENNIKLLVPIEYYSIRHYLRTIRYSNYIKQVIEKYSIDLIHVHYAEPNALWGLRKDSFGCPMVLTTRGSDILVSISEIFVTNTPINFVLRSLYKKALRKFNVITCTSTKQCEKVVDITGCGDNVKIVRTGVDTKAVLESSDEHLPVELACKKYILFPRSMTPLYNHEFSINAVARLSHRIKLSHTMVFVNADNSNHTYVAKIKEMLQDLENVNYLFLKSQPPKVIYSLYKNADLVVMNPISDGTPVSALEAMLCETPVIVGPLPYDVDLFNGTVHKLSEWDENELASLITSVLEGTQKISTLESKHKVLKMADRNNEMKKLEKIYSILNLEGNIV